MIKQIIHTSIGTIAVFQNIVPNTAPVIFLHGVYYDHELWKYHTDRITGRTVIAIDMPHHGGSKNILKKNWNMDDCAQMLLEIIGQFRYKQVYAIGHSWGSMTILRACVKAPERFIALGLCNMPFKKGTLSTQIQFGFQHLMLPFREFYTRQVAKAMFLEDHIKAKPEIVEYLTSSMALLSNREVRKTDHAVIMKVDDGSKYLNSLKVPTYTLKGSKDYVGSPKNIPMTIVEGAHTSPLEQPDEVLTFVRKVLSS